MYRELIGQRKKEFDAVLEFAKNEAGSIRTGRANPSLVEDLPVEYMGSRLRIKEVASITTPEPRVIVIQPWDPAAIAAIEKAISESSIGLNPANDGHAVRLTIPPLTEERRKEFIKVLNQKMEEARIRMRQVRDDILKKVQNAVKEKTAREDEVRLAKDELQKITDDINKKIDEMIKKKESELMTS
ncbi:MAG: ribosome recycling factor [Candidatus Yanofskybacteria bacterium RIFCSPHIGHO2_02_FULL_50_12]|uniref:Ribosome-recycling factor n=1 Tax=Candidatus Yanofskybacteria bacterium RIFCSPHIGHO2_02_FULL_50_12 TaxID=1802685 RepID=A0A1F8FUN9_9BACT|nr:MAG: ribosome recycling factor [Candidatus Yanofskybacteria bacterium RIFCSPHIGHO2_02_FULL_50_12]